MNGYAPDRRYGVALLALILATSVALMVTARLQFDWFDMSAFLDAGWRTAGGQQPYVDFFYIAQPVHLWMHALFFRLFGFNQYAVLAHLLAVHIAFSFLLAYWARRRLASLPAFLVTTAGVVAFSGPVAHPWYDLTATLWFLAGLVALDAGRGGRPDQGGTSTPRRGRALALVASGFLASLSFFTKANIGLGAFLALGGQVLFLSPRARSVGGFAAGALLCAAAVLLSLVDPMEFIRQAFFAYPSSGRLGNLLLLYDVLTVLPFTWCALLVLGASLAGGRAWCRDHVLAGVEVALVAVAGIFGAFTGSLGIESKGAFAGPMLVVAWSLVSELPAPRRRVFTLVAALLTTAVLGQSLFASWPPHAWLWRPTSHESTYAMRHESFRGWRTAATFGPGIDRAAAFLEANVPRDEPLLILPDATALYGMTGRQGYRGAPFLFHIRQVPPPGRDLEAFRSRVGTSPPKWILLHRQEEIPWAHTEATLQWLGLEPLLDSYTTVHRDPDFTVHRRR